MDATSLEAEILRIAADLEQLFRGQYAAITLLGAAARNEATFSADGQMLSDLDFLVILRASKRWTFWRTLHQLRSQLAQVERLASARPVHFHVGLGSALPGYWAQATPLMWEFRVNGRVLYGDRTVTNWPRIQISQQIPLWEGLRLVANRLCELLGSLSESLPDANMTLRYNCLKLILACNESVLIAQGLYRATYRERLPAHQQTTGWSSSDENELIRAAYNAKLGLNVDFFAIPESQLAYQSIKMALEILHRFGTASRSEWLAHLRRGCPSSAGLGMDILYFLQSRGSVALRSAIVDVYIRAQMLTAAILDDEASFLAGKFASPCHQIFHDFKTVPQAVAILTTKEGQTQG
jgi:hypothetical protein